MKNRWVWIGAGIILAMCWPVTSVVLGRRASAQVVTSPLFSYPFVNPQFAYQRLGGPLIYNPGNRPMTIFAGGQFSTGFYDPTMFNLQPQAPTGYYLIPVDPNAVYAGTFANMPAGAENGQATASGRATGIYPIARTNDMIEADYEKSGKLWVQWQGETAAARAVHFALLDRNRTVLKQVSVDQLPAEARFEADPKAAYLQAIVVYVNGTTNSTVFPLQPPATKTPVAPEDKPAAPPKADGDTPTGSR